MKIVKAAAFLLLAAALWLLNHRYFHFTPEGVKRHILSFGVWSPLIYIIVYTIRPLLFFPATVLCLAGGLAFGPVRGTVYTMIGFTCDSILVFVLARKFGGRLFSAPTGRILAWRERLEKRSFITVFTLRLIPVVPFDVTSVAAGLSSVRFLPYIGATVIGTAPVTIAYSMLGDRLTRGFGPALLLALLLVLVFALLPFLWLRRGRRGRIEES
ncbi:TVP38/TMEM64 family protein [Paenibacillus xanthanilyticus]|uniref:TVP38/TMEM64 family membrane protein n=1 Tax=Paenibacillus xanthanilyticus TaxID=1783531 RepID=A0ABV8K7K7_9BACL